MKRAGKARGSKGSVQLIRILKSPGIDRDDRIEAGTPLVIGLDPVQIELDQLVGSQPAGFVGILNILDCRFRKMKRFALALAVASKKSDEKKQRERTANAPRNVPLGHRCPPLCHKCEDLASVTRV